MKFNKEKVKAMVMEQLSEQPGFNTERLEDLLDQLLDQMSDLNTSIDYLTIAATGDDPTAVGGAGSAGLGRLARTAGKARKRNRNLEMQEAKYKLKSIIEEVISEQDAPEAIEKAVESDAGLEELLAAMAERMSELENEIQRLKSEYSNASARMGRITGEQE